MKTLIKSTAAALVGMAFAGAALADGPFCERPLSYGANETPGAERVFYAHGCDRFQYQPLSDATLRNLLASGACDVESYASGGTVEEEVEVPTVEYDTADGSQHERDNLTSMGVSTGTGDHVLRVRSASAGNPVSIQRYGAGEVWAGTVGAGDTFVRVGDAGTYIATTGSRTITKATGNQPFNDVETVTVEREVGNVDLWTNPNDQPGPRTARCGFPGEAIAPLN